MAGNWKGAGADAIVTCADRNGYRVVCLNRPERMNALTADLLQALLAELQRCGADGHVRAMILTGAGRAFCSGQDLGDRDPRKIEWPPDLEAIQRTLFHPIILTMKTMNKPVIVAVNGVAAGAGLSLALAGDIVLAARSAQFIPSFVKVGLSVDAGAGFAITCALGAAKARHWLMSGEARTSEDLERCGLIANCYDDEALMNAAEALAARLAAGPTRAYALIKATVQAAAHAPNFASYLDEEAKLQGEAGRSDDYREGVLAFLEKRRPVFQGR